MRRNDREVTDKGRIAEVIDRCYCCRLGLNDNGLVYIVPLSFGFLSDTGSLVFYFHSAKEGRKIELIQNNPAVGFELDTNYRLNEADTACHHSAGFQSVIGNGVVSMVDDYDEKLKGLQLLMKHTTGKSDWKFDEEMVNSVCVFKLVVNEISCKEHK